MKLITVITNKGKSETFIKSCAQLNLLESVTFIGKGTAPTEILDALSLADTDKDVVFAFANDSDVEAIFKFLVETHDFEAKGKGVAFAIPLSGISAKTYQILNEQLKGDQ